MNVTLMTNLDLSGAKVLIREDLNVPIHDGQVSSDARIRAAVPTIRKALDQAAQVILMSHLGRPSEGEFTHIASLQPVADHLSVLLGEPVTLIRNWQNGLEDNNNKLVMLENVRFNEGEKANDDTLAQSYAALCDIFVMDAFGTAHRAQASTHGVAKYAPIAISRARSGWLRVAKSRWWVSYAVRPSGVSMRIGGKPSGAKS